MSNSVIDYQIIEDESKLDLPEYIDNPHYVKNKTAKSDRSHVVL